MSKKLESFFAIVAIGIFAACIILGSFFGKSMLKPMLRRVHNNQQEAYTFLKTFCDEHFSEEKSFTLTDINSEEVSYKIYNNSENTIFEYRRKDDKKYRAVITFTKDMKFSNEEYFNDGSVLKEETWDEFYQDIPWVIGTFLGLLYGAFGSGIICLSVILSSGRKKLKEFMAQKEALVDYVDI